MKNFILCMVLSAALIGCADKKETPASTTTAKQTAADAGAGKIIAERDCKACHGANGGGGGPAVSALAGRHARRPEGHRNAYERGGYAQCGRILCQPATRSDHHG